MESQPKNPEFRDNVRTAREKSSKFDNIYNRYV